MSTITVSGRLTHDPELRFTPSGRAVLNVSIAENHARKTDAGWEETGTSYYRIVRWGGATSSTEVEAIAASLAKGDRVLVTGRLVARTYADKTTGAARSSTELIADEIAASFRGVTEIAVTRQTRTGAEPGPAEPTGEPPF
jgi:single-strand DNA-binding protein